MDFSTTVLFVAVSLRILWLAVEVWQRRSFPVKANEVLDSHSGRLWDIANAIEPIGLVLAFLGVGRVQNLPQAVQLGALVLLISGIIIRFTAIRTLGRFFTGEVTIREDHRLVNTGLYKYVRHPAYTGALLSHAGLGLAFGSWVSLSLSVLPFVVAAFYRIGVEEKALSRRFGEDYTIYAKATHRLIPRVY
jgi:protein-S-isoprenylcysteine O-methyltransferase Ste14